ncbi:hypothetical protein AAC387_Pa05g0242 [Persea americana]
MLREKALRTAMEHIHYADENTRSVCIGPVNKVWATRSGIWNKCKRVGVSSHPFKSRRESSHCNAADAEVVGACSGTSHSQSDIKLDPYEEEGLLGDALQSGRAVYVSADLRNKAQVVIGAMSHYTSSSSSTSTCQGSSHEGELPPVTFGENGQPIGGNSVQLSSKIGEVVRTYVSPIYLKWSDVPNELKELVWEIVSHSFEVPEYSKRDKHGWQRSCRSKILTVWLLGHKYISPLKDEIDNLIQRDPTIVEKDLNHDPVALVGSWS